MTLIPLEEDRRTIAARFRKAPMFAFLDEGQIIVQENPHKHSKSPEFFDYFNTLGVDTLYVKALGFKTFLKLHKLGIEVYLIKEAEKYNRITPDGLERITLENADAYCTLGHHNREQN